MSNESVEIKIRLPLKVHDALTFYTRLTSYWVCNDDEDKSISEYVADIVEEWLKMEAREPQDAIEETKRILQEKLDLEAEAP